jgi:hypothetical protein
MTEASKFEFPEIRLLNLSEYRLRSFINGLGDCETLEERNQTMKGIIGEAADILTKRPDLLRRWLLEMDRINKRFMLMKQHVAAGPNESLLVHSAEGHRHINLLGWREVFG